MTALGINASDREPTVGWEAIKPSRKPMPKAVAEAWENLQAARADVDRWTDEEVLFPELHTAMRLEREAQIEYSRLWQLWQDHYNDAVLPAELTETVDEREAVEIFAWLDVEGAPCARFS